MFKELLARAEAQMPVSVMARVALQWAIKPAWVDEVFEAHRQRQYPRELLFSTVVELVSLVSLGLRPSLHAAARKAEGLPVENSSSRGYCLCRCASNTSSTQAGSIALSSTTRTITLTGIRASARARSSLNIALSPTPHEQSASLPERFLKTLKGLVLKAFALVTFIWPDK